MTFSARVPSVNQGFLCVVDKERTDLAAVISSYFSVKGVYFPVFTFLGVQHADQGQDDVEDDEFVSKMIGAEAAVVLSNALARLGSTGPIILAGLSAAQTSYLRLPDGVPILEITTLDEVREKLRTVGVAKKEQLRCKRSQLLLGLYVAQRTDRSLEIADDADDLTESENHAGGLVLVEEAVDNAACVVAINYAHSIGANVKIVGRLDRSTSRRVLGWLQKWREDHDTTARDALFAEIEQRIGTVDFRAFEYATFFTEGLPYSLMLESVIPCSYVNLSLRADHFVFNNLRAERGQSLAAAVIFTTDEFAASGETQWLVKFLKDQHYFVRSLDGRKATSQSFGYHAEHFPYGILHIVSHGGEVDGYSVAEEFIDRKGVKHLVEYDEVVGLSRVPGDDRIRVERKVIFKALDGLDWNDPARRQADIPHYVYEDMRKKLFAKGTWGEGAVREHKSNIPWSCAVRCNDGIHQAMFRSVAAYGSPLVFNNTCWSWAGIADFFLTGGARAYVGTLWAVPNALAVAATKVFYENALGDGIVKALHLVNRSINDTEDADIYIVWGLHFSTLSRGRSYDESAAAVFRRMAQAVSMYVRHLNEVTASDARDNAIEALELLEADVGGTFSGPVAERVRANARVALRKAGPKTRSGAGPN